MVTFSIFNWKIFNWLNYHFRQMYPKVEKYPLRQFERISSLTTEINRHRFHSINVGVLEHFFCNFSVFWISHKWGSGPKIEKKMVQTCSPIGNEFSSIKIANFSRSHSWQSFRTNKWVSSRSENFFWISKIPAAKNWKFDLKSKKSQFFSHLGMKKWWVGKNPGWWKSWVMINPGLLKILAFEKSWVLKNHGLSWVRKNPGLW